MYDEKRETAQAVFRLASHLLQYPDAVWEDSLEGFRQIAETLGDDEAATSLNRFLHRVIRMGIETLRELYVQTFDFGKKTNLYVTYARHGEQRERGPALIALKQYYTENGFHMVDDELSDYLPLMLEFISIAPLDAAKSLISEHRPAIEDIRAHLVKIDSPYVDVFDAINFAMDALDIRSTAEGGTVT